MAKKKNENEEIKEEIKKEETTKEKENEKVKDEAKKTGTEKSSDNSKEDELLKKYEGVNEKYMRTLAEYDNYRKRTIKEKEAIYPEAKAVVVEKFLAVIDNFERALQSCENHDSFYEGVEMVKKQMDEVLKNLGVEEIKAVGETFDPTVHNAVMHVDDENLGENTVCEEFQKGYRIGDRVIRASMVKVAN